MVASIQSVGCSFIQKWSRVPDLFTDQGSLPYFRVTHPFADKQLSQERVQRLLLTTELLTTAAVLLAQCAEEPLENQQSTLRGIGLLSWCHEEGGVFGPVGGILGERGSRQDEGRSGQRG